MADPLALLPQFELLQLRAVIPPEGERDETLGCILCSQPRCEYLVEYRLPGRRIGVGLHKECRDYANQQAPSGEGGRDG